MELWDAYDAMENRLDRTLVRGEKVPEGLYHLVAHIWYRNMAGEILVQRRALERELAPGLWAATGGSALQGETIAQAIVRESNEEMGIDPDLSRSAHILSYSTIDSHTKVYLVPFEGEAGDLHLQKEEVMDAKWISVDELESLIGRPEIFWQYRYLPMLVRYLRENPVSGGKREESPV